MLLLGARTAIAASTAAKRSSLWWVFQRILPRKNWRRLCDEELLRAFVDSEDSSLSEIEREQVRRNLAHFRSWRAALGAIFLEREGKRGSEPP